MGYNFLEHTADVKFRADGETLGEMFVCAMDALNETIYGDIKILELSEKSFEVKGGDKLSLLYGFLEEVLVMLDRDEFVIAGVKSLEIEDGVLRCVVVGDEVKNYVFTNDVKAITYSEMFVREAEKGWECQVVLDV